MSLSSQVAHVVDRIYDAAVGASTWSGVAQALEHSLNGPTAIFVQRDRPVEVLAMCCNTLNEEAKAQQYLTHYWTEDRAMQRIRNYPSDDVVLDQSLIDDRERSRSAFYGEFLEQTKSHRGLYAPVLRQDDATTVVSVMRSRSFGDYDAEELRFVRLLQPHFQRGLRVFNELRRARLAEKAALATLSDGGVGILFTTAQGALQFATPLAEQQLADGALTVAKGRLRANTPAASQRLNAAIAAAAQRSGGIGADLQLPLADGAGTVQVAVAPARQAGGLIASEPLAMVIVGQTQPSSIDEDRARAAFGLTPAEARLLSALVSGERLADFADRSGVSVNTAKTHLARLFRKTGETRQADLIRRALSDRLIRLQIGEAN